MEKFNTPEELHAHEMNEHGKSLKPKRTRKKKGDEQLFVEETSTTETKPCKTCKKKKDLKLPEFDPQEDFLYAGDELRQVYAYLLETKKLTDPNIAEYSKRIYKDVTGQELNVQGCLGCKSSGYRRTFKYWCEKRYNVILK